MIGDGQTSAEYFHCRSSRYRDERNNASRCGLGSVDRQEPILRVSGRFDPEINWESFSPKGPLPSWEDAETHQVHHWITSNLTSTPRNSNQDCCYKASAAFQSHWEYLDVAAFLRTTNDSHVRRAALVSDDAKTRNPQSKEVSGKRRYQQSLQLRTFGARRRLRGFHREQLHQ